MASRYLHLAYTTTRGIALLVPFAVHLLVADLLLSLLLPVSLLLPDLTYHLSSALAGSVWSHIQHIFEASNSARILSSGDALPRGESALVIANHNAWSDFYLIQHLAAKAEMLPYCRWFAKAQLKRVPLLGWGLWAMGMPLVTRNWTSDRAEMERVFRGPRERAWPVWLVSFSEATRFTRRKYEQGVEWCVREGRPVMRHVLYPRFKGWVASVGALRGKGRVGAVYDFTIAYARRRTGRGSDGSGMGGKGEGWEFMEAPDIWTTLSKPALSGEWRFWVKVRRYELSDLPTEAKELETWLEARWVEKGEILEALRLRIKAGEATESVRL